MKVYVVLVEDYSTESRGTSKVSQQGYSTFEEAQSFCLSRSAKSMTRCCNGWVYWADATRYEIMEVTI